MHHKQFLYMGAHLHANVTTLGLLSKTYFAIANLLSSIIQNANTHTYTVFQKTAKLFLSEVRQISTNFDNFWQNDGKGAKIMRGALIFHLT